MIQALTIDFWNTLFTSSNGEVRRAYRNRAIHDVLAAQGRSIDDGQLAAAIRHVYAMFERTWFGEHRTPTTAECMRIMWEFLGVQPTDAQHARVVSAFEDSILIGIPDPLPGATDVIPLLASRYRLGIISDTAFSPGRVLRTVLERHGLLRYFDHCVFSDETGVSKPHERAFRTAVESLGAEPGQTVHIGDIERTDIRGAHDFGMKSILFLADGFSPQYDSDGKATLADAVATRWEEIPGILQQWNGVSDPS